MPRSRMGGEGPCCGRGAGHADGPGGPGGRGGGMRGLVEPAVLAALGAQPAHGYDLRAAIEALTDGVLVIDPGGLYRILRRMEDDGLVASAWEAGDHGPQRRTYRLTAEGTDVLRCWLDRLDARRRAIDGIVAAATAATADGPTPTNRPTGASGAGDDDTRSTR